MYERGEVRWQHGKLFSHWKQAVAEQLHQVTLELFVEKATKSVVSAIDYSRQQTYASNLQEIRKMQEMVHELQHKQDFSWKKHITFQATRIQCVT